MPSCYQLAEFLDACRSNIIYLPNDVRRDAATIFGLTTQTQLCSYLWELGEERLEYFNTCPLERDPALQVDAYEFAETSKRIGYVAFYVAKTGRWVVKSFHLSVRSKLTTRPFDVLKGFFTKKDDEE